MAETYTYKADHAEDSGNSYAIGVTDARNTTATRVGYFYSDGGSEVGLKAAADAAYSAAGPVHPHNGALSLKGCRASRVAPNIVRVTLYYNGRVGINSGRPPAEMVRSDSGFVTFKTWHRSVFIGLDAFDNLGRPIGQLNHSEKIENSTWNKDRSRPPQPLYFQVPIQLIRVPGLLSSDPSHDVVDLIGLLNSDTLNLVGKDRPAGTLQFQRFWCEPIVIDNAVKYRVEYTLVYKRSLWAVELPPTWSDATGGWEYPEGVGAAPPLGNNWYSFIADRAPFLNAFPVED